MIDIKNSNDAAYFIQQAIRSHEDMWIRVQNQEDILLHGKKPFNEKKLIESGYDWVCNMNYQKGHSKLETDIQENIADVKASIGFFEIEFCKMNPKKYKDKLYHFLEDDELKEKIRDAIVNVFADTLDFDPCFGSWIGKSEYVSYMFGHCSVTRDQFGYLGYPNHVRSIAYEDRTEVSKITSFILFDVVKAEYLYKELRNLGKFTFTLEEVLDYTDPKGPQPVNYKLFANGWIEEGLVEVFRRALLNSKDNIKDANAKDATGKYIIPICNTWEDVTMFVNRWGLPWVIQNINNVYIAKLYYFDEDQHFIEVYVSTQTDILYGQNYLGSIGTGKYLLYKKDHGRVETRKQINVIRNTAINANDYIHELKGAGKLIAEDSLRFDIKRCKLEDRLTLNGCSQLDTSNAYEQVNMKMAVVGGVIIPEAGVKILPATIQMDLSPFVESIKLDEEAFRRESNYLQPSVQGNLSDRATTQEVSAVQGEVARNKSARTVLKFSDYAFVFYNALYDLVDNTGMDSNNKLVQDYFFEQLLEELSDIKELTKEQITKIVKTVKRIKFSPVLRDPNAIKQAMELAGNSQQRSRLQRMYLMALGFSRQEARDIAVVEDYGTQVSIAALENAAFQTTSEVAFGLNQDHVTHNTTHFAKMDRVFQGLQQGGDPVQAFHFIINALQNTAQHNDAIKDSYFYADKFKLYNQAQKFFTQAAQKLSAQIMKMKEQAAQAQAQGQQQQQQLDPKTAASIYNANQAMIAKIKRTDMLTQQGMQRKITEASTKLALLEKESQAKIQRDTELAQNKKDIQTMMASLQTITNKLSNGIPQPEQAAAA